MTIEFNRVLNYSTIGRNGVSKSKGLSIYENAGLIEFIPINSKGNETRCQIEIPKENIDDLIEILKTLK